MIPRIDTRVYTNVVLTVIAAVLVAGTLQQNGLSLVPSAQAQLRDNRDNISRTANGVAVATNIPQTQDVAVAAATSEVAESNREIAAALKEVAVAIREGMRDLQTGLRSTSPAAAAPAGSASPVAPAPAPANRPTIEVSQ